MGPKAKSASNRDKTVRVIGGKSDKKIKTSEALIPQMCQLTTMMLTSVKTVSLSDIACSCLKAS